MSERPRVVRMALDQVLPREEAELARHPIVTNTIRNMIAEFRRGTGYHPTHLRIGTVLHAHLARELVEVYGMGLVLTSEQPEQYVPGIRVPGMLFLGSPEASSHRGRVLIFEGMDIIKDEGFDRMDRLQCYADRM